MRKKKYLLGRVILVGFLVCLLIAGGVFAYMYKKTAVTSNKFVPAEIVCTLNETYDKTSSQKNSITITNDKEKGSNINAYLRVMLVSYWVDDEGNVVSKASEMPTIEYDQSKWVKSATDHIYYYKEPVEPEETTSNLLEEGKVISLTEDTSANIYQVVEVFAEGIQANPTSTVSSAWGVTISGTTITSAQ